MQKTSQNRKKKSSKTRKNRQKGRNIPFRWWMPVVALAALALLLAIPYLGMRGGETGAPLPPGAYHYGIDISHHNGKDIVWDSLLVMTDRLGRTTRSLKKASSFHPVSFVFIKATEGTSHLDRHFRENWDQASRHGLKRGAYHFFRTSRDPLAQAKHYIETVGPLRHGDFPPVLDVETMHLGCTRQELNQGVLLWLQTVEKHYGRKPVIYTGDRFLTDFLDPEISGHYPLWIAHYGVSAPDTDAWTWWQFTDRAVVYGVPGRVDLSVSR